MITRLVPPTVEVAKQKEGDPRLGHLLGRDVTDSSPPLAVIIGFPTHEGVRRNGGRIGAAKAPDAIRRAFYGLAPDAGDCDRFSAIIRRVVDLGDIEVSGDLEKDQEKLGTIVATHLEAGVLPIVLGGGHETAFGHFLGYVHASRPVEIINIDAHPDVRPLVEGKAHSGSPFYQALLHPSKICQRYTVAGLLPHSAAATHCTFIKEHDGRHFFKDDLIGMSADDLITPRNASTSTMMTFDLDVLDQSIMPGVSAPAVDGLDLSPWLLLAEGAGARSEVTSIDIVELNPTFDLDGRSAKVAALTLWRFVKGLGRRFQDVAIEK